MLAQSGRHPADRAGAAAIYSHRNCDAARHLYRVTAGLESMIVGEAEIQGQVKRAYEAAIASETVGPLTNHLFKAALATGKRVRTETAIGERQLSLPAVAVALARELLGDARRARGRDRRHRRDRRAGRPGARRQRRPARVRRQPPARPGDLAWRAATAARAMSFDELPAGARAADILVAATASPHLLLEAARAGRGDGRLRGGGRCC